MPTGPQRYMETDRYLERIVLWYGGEFDVFVGFDILQVMLIQAPHSTIHALTGCDSDSSAPGQDFGQEVRTVLSNAAGLNAPASIVIQLLRRGGQLPSPSPCHDSGIFLGSEKPSIPSGYLASKSSICCLTLVYLLIGSTSQPT